MKKIDEKERELTLNEEITINAIKDLGFKLSFCYGDTEKKKVIIKKLKELIDLLHLKYFKYN